MKKILLVLTIFMLSACTDYPEAYKTLQSAGFTDISTGGYGWFACGRDDFYATKFTATNPNGVKVSGVVCSGLIVKSSTVRF